jgi:nicotinamidase-related amidase
VDDGTGKVLINPQGVEYDLPSTYWAEFGPRAKGGPWRDPSLGLAASPSEQDLRAYAAKADPAFTVAEKVIAQLDQKSAHSGRFAQKLLERQKQVFEAQNPLTGNGSYRITEHCLVAEHEYDVVGTCAQNPQPQGDGDQNLILKGQSEPTFVISGFSELKLEKLLRKRALSRIILGGFLMVITMGIIIAELVSP